MLFGTFTHTIDTKGRTALPARLREGLAADNEARIVLMRNPESRAVLALPESVFNKAAANVGSASPFDGVAQRNVFKFFSTAHHVDLDQSGRVLVPPDLRAFAGLQKDVVWVGMGSYLLLFDKAAHEAQMEQDLPADQRWDFFQGR